ncbi:nucleoside phosphorylase domain-containing protein [Podospora fimiseda]|uniref:Nucleoside phosphorylase domain-containing protein n=1 Tax=Podospora fimiseda TaxID=252190 RepID=A0AAN7BKS0_9PEZI|nr:nucleoside phosphorylase domain-containing protein [Podospora fimiseda]
MQCSTMNLKRPRQDEESLENHPKRPRTRTIDNASHAGVDTSHDQLTHQDYAIAWICALPRELSASRAMLDEEHTQVPSLDRDDNVYILGCIHRHNVVMTCLPGQYGTNNAAIAATNLKRSFPNIRASLMVGIGGRSPSQADLYLGDVVVGTRIMQYDMGKVTAGGLFQETADAKIPTQLLSSAVAALQSRHDSEPGHMSHRIADLRKSRLPRILRPNRLDYPDHLFQASYEHHMEEPTCVSCDLTKLQPRQPRISDEPKIHYGVIASGNSVIKDGTTRDNIAARFSGKCFEMEAAGVGGRSVGAPTAGMMDNLQCLPIRGICDYSDSHKNKVTTITAAHTKTCRWILEHEKYLDWLNDGKQSQNHGFLWIRGKAGPGKSTMMKFVYIETKKTSKKGRVTVASFLFNARGNDLERSVSGMYRSLLLQLLQEFSYVQYVLDNTNILPRNQQGCPGLNTLKELLNSAVMKIGNRRFTCFVDARDECDKLEAWDMVQFFEDLAENAANQGIQFQICFSSRPYPYIDTRQGIVLTLEEESGHREDLAHYSSHGALALRKKLSELPAKLGELFKNMLTRDQQRPESLKLSILWILCATRPLSPAEFQCAMWVGLSEHGIVDAELPDNGIEMDAIELVAKSSVQFIHKSELWPELGFEWEAQSQEILKRCCDTYLNHPRVQPIFTTEGRYKDIRTVILYHANAAAPVVL